MSQSIVILSGKGGVGKTTMALNLGGAMNRFGRHVIILDANLTTPHIGLALGSTQPKPTLNEVLAELKHPSESVHVHPSGVRVVPANINYKYALNVSSSGLKMVVDELKKQTELVLIDAPSGFGENVQNAIKAADSAIIVLTPDVLSTADALRAVNLLKNLEKPIYGLVINKIDQRDKDKTIESVQKIVGHTVIGVVPRDPQVRDALNLRYPVVVSHPESKAAIAILKIAGEIIGADIGSENEIKKPKSLVSHAMDALGFSKREKS